MLGNPTEKTLLVLNRVSNQSQISVEDIETHLKGQLKGRIPDEPTLVLRSINEGVPIALGDPETRFARAINNLAVNALMAAFAKDSNIVDEKAARIAISETGAD